MPDQTDMTGRSDWRLGLSRGHTRCDRREVLVDVTKGASSMPWGCSRTSRRVGRNHYPSHLVWRQRPREWRNCLETPNRDGRIADSPSFIAR